MSNRFVRSSKYRHIFGTAVKKDLCYDNIKISKSPHESNMCAVNSKFIAVVLEAQGGGAFMVAKISEVGRFDINYPKITGHEAKILDVAWNPFDENEIASCSEDCKVKLWTIPDEGIKSNMSKDDCICELIRHERKVLYVLWHPSASDVLLSAGQDHAIFIWNTKTKGVLTEIKNATSDLIYSVSWNYNGAFFAVSSKDKKIRVFDAHSGEVKAEGTSHPGTKPCKVAFCGKSNKLFSTGFSRSSDRQYALWDPLDLSKSLKLENIDVSSGVLFPFWDEGTQVMYLAGKGDTQIRYFEVTDTAPYVFFLSMYQPKIQHRGVAAMPKKEVDYMKCEVMRFFRIMSEKGYIEPTAMTVPRKSDMFQDDIYPPCPAGKPALTADEWGSGVDKVPLLVEFTASGIKDLSPDKYPAYKNLDYSKKADAGKKEPSVLKRLGSPPPDKAMPVTLNEYRDAYKELLAENAELKARLAKLEGK